MDARRRREPHRDAPRDPGRAARNDGEPVGAHHHDLFGPRSDGGYGFVTAYAASKHGVIGLTRSLAAELGSQGYPSITVNAICPGYVRAGMGIQMQSTKAGPMPGEEIFERYYKRQVPQRRMIEPEEIANAAVFLALPGSAGITDQALNVDGGFVMS